VKVIGTDAVMQLTVSSTQYDVGTPTSVVQLVVQLLSATKRHRRTLIQFQLQFLLVLGDSGDANVDSIRQSFDLIHCCYVSRSFIN